MTHHGDGGGGGKRVPRRAGGDGFDSEERNSLLCFLFTQDKTKAWADSAEARGGVKLQI